MSSLKENREYCQVTKMAGFVRIAIVIARLLDLIL